FKFNLHTLHISTQAKILRDYELAQGYRYWGAGTLYPSKFLLRCLYEACANKSYLEAMRSREAGEAFGVLRLWRGFGSLFREELLRKHQISSPLEAALGVINFIAAAEELNVLWFARKLSAADVIARANLLIQGDQDNN